MMWLSDMHTDTPLPPVPPPPPPTVLGYPGHVAYSYKGILFSHKKKWNSDRQTSTTWINERNERWKNWKNEVKPDPRRTNVAWLHLCGAPRAGDFREKEGDGMLVRPVQRGDIYSPIALEARNPKLFRCCQGHVLSEVSRLLLCLSALVSPDILGCMTSTWLFSLCVLCFSARMS